MQTSNTKQLNKKIKERIHRKLNGKYVLDLTTVTTEDLVQKLDRRFNYCGNWKATVYTQKNLEDIAHNVLVILKKRDKFVYDDEIYVHKHTFETVLETVIDIYEGFIDLKTL